MTKFSVLLSVYSKEKSEYLDQAFLSIWSNQSLKPAQIVLVKDGPLGPNLETVIKSWQLKLGSVLTVVELPASSGLGPALNAGLQHCIYNLIARMDTDDISLPDRFEKQVAFMDKNPDIAASSAFVEEFDDNNSVVFIRRVPECHEEITKFAKKRCPLNHPVVIFRREAVFQVGGYPPFFPEDSALWTLLITQNQRLANIPSVLLKMRTTRDFIYRRGLKFLRGEIGLLAFQKKIGFLTWPEYMLSLAIRVGVRLPPSFIRRWLYKVAR